MNENISHTKKDKSEILPVEYEEIDHRLKRIERIAETIEGVTEKGFELVDAYFKNQSENEHRQSQLADLRHKREIELQDKQQNRALIILISVIFFLSTLVMYAMYLKEFDLVKIILGVAISITSGAGMVNFFMSKTNATNKD